MICIKHASFWVESPKFENQSFDLICTDPPYRSYSSRGAGRKKPAAEIQGVFQEEDFLRFAQEAFRLLKWNRHIYVFTREGKPYISTYNALIKAGFVFNRTLIWAKTNFVKTGDFYSTFPSQTELIIFAEKLTNTSTRRKLSGSVHSNLLTEFLSVPNERMSHPTQKPVRLIQFLVEKSTEPKEVVLDPFVGSGSCLFACRNSGRSFFGFEIVETYMNQISFQLGQPIKDNAIRQDV